MKTMVESKEIAKTQKLFSGRRSTGITHILRKISETVYSDNETLISGGMSRDIPQCRFLVASDRETRERAYRLAYEIYEASHLVEYDPSGMVVSPHDAGPETFTLLAEDDKGEAIGTVSLVFDSEKGLPCDEIYGDEVNKLRIAGGQAVEVTRLAMKKSVPSSRDLLVRLFNLIYIYSVRVRGYTDFVIEVNPRHVPYYEKTLRFERIGGLKSCPRVEGAPAVLARLDLSIPTREVMRIGGKRARGQRVEDRTLYSRFWAFEEEEAIARHLEWQYTPMSEEEAATFGIVEHWEPSEEYALAAGE